MLEDRYLSRVLASKNRTSMTLEINSKNLLAFDTETHLFRPGLMAPRMVCSSWSHVGAGPQPSAWLTVGIPQTVKEVREVLEDNSITLVLANAAYDMVVLMATDPSLIPLIFQAYNKGRIYDVLIGCALIAIHQGNLGYHPVTRAEIHRYSLARAVDIYLGRDNAKANDSYRLRYGELDGVPESEWPEEARQYPLDDARNTLEVCLAQLKTKDPNLSNMSAQAKAALALHLSSVWGQRTDGLAVAELEAMVDKKLAEAVGRFKTNGLIAWDPKKKEFKTNTIKVKTLVAESYGASGACPSCGGSGKVTSPANKNKKNPTQINCGDCSSTGLDLSSCQAMPRTPAGGIQADRDGLVECDNEELTLFSKVSELRKLKETYIPFLKTGINVPINTNANVLVASGRTSYDGLTQTMPRGWGVRECFIPRKGWRLISVDYNSLELGTLAQAQIKIVGTSVLADALNKGLDPHAYFASKMIGVSYDDFMVVLADKTHPLFKKYKGFRQGAKEGNFGFPGGMGAATLVRSARKKGVRFCMVLGGEEKCGRLGKVTEWQKRPTPPVCLRCVGFAQGLKDQWMGNWPETKPYFDHISDIVNSSCEVTQIGSGRIRGGVDFCNAANTYFQGLAADGAKEALWVVTEAMYNNPSSPLFGSRVFSFVHDEILMESPSELASNAAKELARVMVSTMRKWCPDVTINAEPAMMLAWSKDASPVFNDKGDLIPWTKEA